MKLYNPTTVQRLADHFQHKGYTKDPQEILVSLLDQARWLNSDYEDSWSREFDRDEEPWAFKLRLSDFQTALVDTLAWQEWLETASEEDIKREMRMGNPHLLKLLDDESDKASIDRAQRAPHLFLVKNDNTLPI